MNFIINQTITYDEKQGTLETPDESQDPVSLPRPACRLMSLFVRNNNELLTREFLLTTVWENHGLTASNNNLNNYVSMLRKAFTLLGEEELLVTVPKQGFMLTAHQIVAFEETGEIVEHPPISSKIAEVDIDDSDAFHDGSETGDGGRAAYPVVNSYSKNAAVIGKRRISLSKTVISFIVLIPLCISLMLAYANHEPIPWLKKTHIGNISKCEISFMFTPYKIEKEQYLEIIEKALSKAGYSCEYPARVYFSTPQIRHNASGMAPVNYFFAYCPLSNAMIPSLNCENLHVYEKDI